MKRDDVSPFWAIFSAIALLVVGAVIRSVYLSHFPMQIHNDESAMVIHGFKPLYEGGRSWEFYGSSFAGHPNFGYWLAAIPSLLAGYESIWTLRISSAVLGALSLVFFWLCIVETLGRRAALLFLVFAVPFHFHVHYSRTGFHYIHAVFFFSVVSWLFMRAMRDGSLIWTFLTGLAMGLGAMVYPATHVIPIAMACTVVWIWATKRVCRLLPVHGLNLRVLIVMSVVFLAGLLISFGPQAWLSYEKGGFLSRLNHTWLLHPHSIAHLTPEIGPGPITPQRVIWFNFLKTCRVFYRADSGEQYGFLVSPLPWWGGALALLGLCGLVWSAVRRDAFSLYIVLVGGLTLAASTMMVEGNFTPHLVLFSILVPFACSLGWGMALDLRIVRRCGAVVAVLATVALLVMWGAWNWTFYNRIVDPTRSRLTDTETWVLNLPINTRQVKQLVNFSHREINMEESYFKLVYPSAHGTQRTAADAVKEVNGVVQAGEGPYVFVIDGPQAVSVERALSTSGKLVSRFVYPGQLVQFIYVE